MFELYVSGDRISQISFASGAARISYYIVVNTQNGTEYGIRAGFEQIETDR